MSSAISSRTSASSGRLLGLEQLGDLLDQPRLLHLIGDFGDDHDIGAAALVLDLPAGADAEAAAAGAVGLEDARPVLDDDAAGREIRARARVPTSVSIRAFGFSIRWSAASQSSAALCGGIVVAMPTAMPDEPLARRLGKAPGRTTGSSSLPS